MTAPLIAGITVDKRTNMPTWEQNGATWHINLTTATFHVTEESSNPKRHFFYSWNGDIEDVVPTDGERGKSKVKIDGKFVCTKNKFSDLPVAVQQFVRANYLELIK